MPEVRKKLSTSTYVQWGDDARVGRDNMGVKMGAKESFSNPCFSPEDLGCHLYLQACVCMCACVHVFVHARARVRASKGVDRPFEPQGKAGVGPCRRGQSPPRFPVIGAHRSVGVVCMWEEVRGKETSMSTP